MKKVTQLNAQQHVYEVENCAGCGKEITGDYTELGLPSMDDTEIKHIALCKSCTKIAKDEGVI